MTGRWEEELSIGDFAARVLREGIRDVPLAPEWGFEEMLPIPQTTEEIDIGLAEIEKGLADDSRFWEEEGRQENEMLKGKKGYMVPLAFGHEDGINKDGKQKGGFVKNFKTQKA